MESSSRTRSLWWSGGRSALRELLLGAGGNLEAGRSCPWGRLWQCHSMERCCHHPQPVFLFFPLRPSSKIWAATSLNINAGSSIFIYLSLIYSKRRWERHGDREMDLFMGISNSCCLSGCRG